MKARSRQNLCLILFSPLLLMFTLMQNSFAGNSTQNLLVVRPDGSWPPQEMMVNGELTGFHIELVQAAAHLVGLSVTFKSLPWKRAIEMLKKGDADAITYMAKTSERENFGYFYEENILSKATVGFFIRKELEHEVHFSGELESLKGYSIGSILGFSYHEEFDQTAILNKFNSAENEENLIKMLIAGRIDIAIGHVDLINYLAKGMGVDEEIMFLTPYLTQGRKHYLVFAKAKGDKKSVRQFADAMKRFKVSNSYRDLLNKYGLEE